MKVLRFSILLIYLFYLVYLFHGCSEKIPSTLNEEHLEALRSVRTVRIIVIQKYSKTVGKIEYISLPFEKVAIRLLKYSGTKVLKENDLSYDATIKIKVRGYATSNRYEGIRGSNSYPEWRYDGANLGGIISWEINDFPAFEKDFSGEAGGPWRDSDRSIRLSESPSQDHFNKAFKKSSFVEVLLQMITNIYGCEPLYFALKEEDFIRESALRVAVKMGNKAVIPLISALKDEKAVVRQEAARALKEIKDPRAVEPLIVTLKDRYFSARKDAAEALGELKDTRAVEHLITSLLQDESDHVREAAATALGKIEDTTSVNPLISALNDKHYFVQVRAAKALGQIKDTRAVEPLIKALGDANTELRSNITLALSEYNDARTVEYLINILSSTKKWRIRLGTTEALRKITGKYFGDKPADGKKWNEWWERNKESFQKNR